LGEFLDQYTRARFVALVVLAEQKALEGDLEGLAGVT
jgi:hypothetical protein